MKRTAILFSVGAALVTIAISAYGAVTIPADAMLPSHWNIKGEVDGYASRNVMLLLFPGMIIFTSAVFVAIPHIDPRKENLKRSAGLYFASWFGVLGLCLALHAMIILSAARGAEPDARFILLPLCALLVVIGNFMAKSRSTWFVGLRTPWTLSSEAAWIAANRAAGWFFVLTGVIAGASAFFADVRTAFFIMFAGLMASAAMGIAISYLVWRKDPTRAK